MDANERQDDIRYYMSLGFTEEQATVRADAQATRRKEKEAAYNRLDNAGASMAQKVAVYFK